MFSGQGSQYFQMGRELFKKDGIFHDWMAQLDDIAQDISGESVIEALYSDEFGKGDPFDRTLLTHPAIFMVEYALAQTLIRAGVCPDMVLGASLGSFAAAAVAGFIGFEDACTAVIQQAIAFERCCSPGGMTAVLADPGLYEQDFLRVYCELAAVNFSSHFVISARLAELAEIETILRERNIVYQRLPVSFPFHSRWIETAKASFESFMGSVERRPNQIPLVCCDQATTVSELSGDYFWNVVRRPIRFRETTERLEKQGAHRYIDVGPAGTLATFLKYGLPANSSSTVHAVLSPYGCDQKNFAALLEWTAG
jgi:acyl transferase domain-containing protein